MSVEKISYIKFECDRCGSEQRDDEFGYKGFVVIKEQTHFTGGGNGAADNTICRDCYDDYIKFMQGNPIEKEDGDE